MPIKVLFLCIHNSARSQMAEAWLKKFGGDKYEVESAGLEPGQLNPFAIEVMKEEGIDISKNPVKNVFDLAGMGKTFHFVVTVCDPKASELCPYFPGLHKKISWAFGDPSKFSGTYEEKLEKTREVRDRIKMAVLSLIKENYQ